jgi:hypothetical protein
MPWVVGVVVGGLVLVLILDLFIALKIYDAQGNHAQTIDAVEVNTVQIKLAQTKLDTLAKEVAFEVAGLGTGNAQLKALLQEAGGAILQFDSQLKHICAVLPGCIADPFTLGPVTTTTLGAVSHSVVAAPPVTATGTTTTTTQPTTTTTARSHPGRGRKRR